LSADVTAETRYEKIMQARSRGREDLAGRFAMASRAARAAVTAAPGREMAIRDVAAGVAAPALISFVLWLLEESRRRGLNRLRFLSRDGQILYELTKLLSSELGGGPDLDYIYSSRLTWSLASTDPRRLSDAPWLFNSFIKSNAADLCARLGLQLSEYRQVILDCGASLDPGVRADQPAQSSALLQFLATPEVTRAATTRISAMRRLVLDYAAQHQLADPGTGLVDIGWTGRMVGSLINLCESAGMGRPTVLFWGHEPRPATGWTDPDVVAAYMYNTATGHGAQWRVPNVPFVMETFCMGDHGIVSGYRKDAAGRVRAEFLSPLNEAANTWGLPLYRSALCAFAAALDSGHGLPVGEQRPLVHQLLEAFWCHPTRAEALAWGSYPYDSDPAGTAVRPLARPFTVADLTRGDRAWLAGSLVLSTPSARDGYLRGAPEHELIGAPETDLDILIAEADVHLEGDTALNSGRAIAPSC